MFMCLVLFQKHMEEEINEREDEIYLTRILIGIRNYSSKLDLYASSRLSLGYCENCNVLSALIQFSENSLKSGYNPGKCIWCSKEGKFARFSLDDISMLEQFNMDNLISSIENALGKISYKGICDEGFLNAIEKWKKLSLERKKEDFKETYRLQRELSETREKLKRLECILYPHKENKFIA